MPFNMKQYYYIEYQKLKEEKKKWESERLRNKLLESKTRSINKKLFDTKFKNINRKSPEIKNISKIDEDKLAMYHTQARNNEVSKFVTESLDKRYTANDISLKYLIKEIKNYHNKELTSSNPK